MGLVGSSGGGGATLGHGDAQSFIKCVRRELEVGSRGALELVVVQFVACAKPLDVADMAPAAQLGDGVGGCSIIASSSLGGMPPLRRSMR